MKNKKQAQAGRIGSKQSVQSYMKNNWQLYVMILPAVIYFIVFNYLPMYGIQIAFKDYKAVAGIGGSPWVGLKHFKAFFNAYYFKRLLTNTLVLNVENLLISFRNCMEWLNTCYNEQLLDPEMISQDQNTVESKFKEGNVGFFTAWRLKAMGFDDGVAATCTLYTPGDEGACDYRYIEMATPGAFLTATNAYVPQSLRLLDAMLETEMMYSLYYGEEGTGDQGTGWEYDEDGKINTTDNGTADILNYPGCNTLFFGPGKYIDSVFKWPVHRIEKTEYGQKYEDAGIMQKYSNDYLDLAPLTAEQLQANTLVETDIENAVKENMATFITEGVTDDSWNFFAALLRSDPCWKYGCRSC